MYAEIIADASFWNKLTEIDKEFLRQAVAKGCPVCGGPLHIANYPRKARGVPDAVADAFCYRLSTCCGHCRRRCTPWSVRFLGRRVYVGAVVLVATMTALMIGAARRTLARWSQWWTEQFPTTALWRGVRARFVPAIAPAALPGALLERFAPTQGSASVQALVYALRALAPLTSMTAARRLNEGQPHGDAFTQKMQDDGQEHDLLAGLRAPPS